MKLKYVIHFIFIYALISNAYAEIAFFKDYSNVDKPIVNGSLLSDKDDSSCGGYLFVDKVVSFDRSKNFLLIRTKNKHDFDIYYEIGNVDFDDSKDLIELLKTQDDIVFIGDRCGAKGGIFDVHSLIKLKVIKLLLK